MENKGLQHTSATPREYSQQELERITDNFSEKRIIGHGGFGVVYKGVLDNGEMIAVKKLHNHLEGLDQFENELMKLRGVQHPNIVRLLGYCYGTRHIFAEFDGKHVLADTEDRAICLEYLQGGSLKDHLSDESCGLEWHERYKIIKGICEGLKHLHTGSETPIYHLELKPGNILLDRNMIPKIGDIGMSRLRAGSMQTCVTKNVAGTFGYMPPEYIRWQQISPKSDVFSLGVIMIHVIAGEEGYKECPDMSSQIFIERVHENWGRRHGANMSSQTSQQVKTCTEIALRCVEADRVNRPTIAQIVDELNKVDTAESSAISQNTEQEEYTTPENQHVNQEQKKKNTDHLEEKMKEQPDGRRKLNIPTPVNMDLHKAVGGNSAILSPRSRWIVSKEQYLHDDVLHLQSGLQRLRETLPIMYNFIDVAEWKSHENFVAMLFPELKDAVYDADDLLDEFRWHDMKVKLEGSSSKSPFSDFMDTVIQGSFNRLNDVQGRLDHLSSQLEKMGLHGFTQSFDKTIRPETSSLPNEEKIFGRDKELKQVMGFFGVPSNSKRKRARCLVNASKSTSSSNQVFNNSRITSLPVLPIVGIGGVGKTTLVQHICSQKEVKAHFGNAIWICVSDDFDVKRLTKEVIESFHGKKETSDNLDFLQRSLSNHVNNKRFLIVLDDMWDDALKENGQCWKRFCAPLKTAQEGSMILVTTRCPKVVEGVRTMEPVLLEGLNHDIFWNFFKLCAFGSESSDNDPELERIGRNIVPKLKGSPLAAKTLGRMLRMDLQASHWNTILQSELWELKQEVTDILPALRLSYMYLPFYLKRCFSFCAMYPKDYKFEKEELAEVWVAEGFVEGQGYDSIKKTSCQYFQDLVTRSFFQKVSGGYVIHDLLHDMAQKVSEHDCFILRNKKDFDNVPPNIRHIYVHPSSDFDNSNLLSLCRHTKLRTLICKKQSGYKKSSVLENWCSKLLRIRVMTCASTNELPDSIGNLKHIRYLKISKGRPLSIPPTFCQLYNLQILDVKKCKIESLPDGFNNLSNLQRFVAQGFSYNPVSVCYIDAAEQVQGVRLMKNLNQFREDLVISNVHMLSKDDATEAKLKNKKDLNMLILNWSGRDDSQVMQHNAIEVLQVLQPPMSLRSLVLNSYPGVSLPSWFQNLPSLTSLTLENCYGLVSISCSVISQNINLNEIAVEPDDNNIGIFTSLSEVRIQQCQNLSSVEHFLHPDYVPAIERIRVSYCKELMSLQGERFGSFRSLKHLYVLECRFLNWQSGLVLPSCLQTLVLDHCGDFSACVPRCLENLTSLVLLTMDGCDGMTSIPGTIWRDNLALLEELYIWNCPNLVSIGGAEAVARIKMVWISGCPKLIEADKIMKRV